jgi:hypothetical protein
MNSFTAKLDSRLHLWHEHIQNKLLIFHDLNLIDWVDNELIINDWV